MAVLDEAPQFVVRMDERVGVFLEFCPARINLRTGLSQDPVCLCLCVLYDLIGLLLCILYDRLALPLRLVRLLHHLGCRSLDGGKILVGSGLRSLEHAAYLNGCLGDGTGGCDAQRPVLQLLPQRLILCQTVLIALPLLIENVQQLRTAEPSEILSVMISAPFLFLYGQTHPCAACQNALAKAKTSRSV